MNAKLMIWISIVLSALAQVFLKHGMNRMHSRAAGLTRTVPQLIPDVLCEPWVWLWGGSFGVATALWLLAVQHLDLSYAFPLLSIGYLLVTVLSVIFFKERVDAMRWIAVSIICAGVIVIARS